MKASRRLRSKMGKGFGVLLLIVGILAIVVKWMWSFGSWWLGGAMIVFGLIAMAKGGSN